MADRARHERDTQWTGFGESSAKTKKCNICGFKNKDWIRFCDNKQCSYSMCTPCCDSDPCAKDRLENGCWCHGRFNEPEVKKLKGDHSEKHTTGAATNSEIASASTKPTKPKKGQASEAGASAATQSKPSQRDVGEAESTITGTVTVATTKEVSAGSMYSKPAYSTKPDKTLSALVRSGHASKKSASNKSAPNRSTLNNAEPNKSTPNKSTPSAEHASNIRVAKVASESMPTAAEEVSKTSKTPGENPTAPFEDHPPQGYMQYLPKSAGSSQPADQPMMRSTIPLVYASPESDGDAHTSSSDQKTTSVSPGAHSTQHTEHSEFKTSGNSRPDDFQTLSELREELAIAKTKGKAKTPTYPTVAPQDATDSMSGGDRTGSYSNGGGGYATNKNIVAGNFGRQARAMETTKSASSMPLQLKPVSMDDKTTVIVGGGIIGLSIARELAMVARAKRWDHNIIVVELRDTVFAHASGHNAGILTREGLPISPRSVGLADLAVASMDAWFHFGKDKTFCEETGYTERKTSQVFVQSVSDRESSPHKKPNDWFKGKYGWAYADQEGSFGIVNPQQLAGWLLEECTRLGVGIRTNSELTAIAAHSDGLKRVNITSHTTKTAGEMQCDNLILAAGPWTPQIMSDVLKFEVSHNLRNPKFSAANWLEIRDHRKTPQENSAFLIPQEGLKNFNHPDAEYQLHVVSRKDDRKIWISGSEENVSILGSALDDAKSTRQASMRRSSSEYPAGNPDLIHQPEDGRSFNIEMNGGLPLMARIPLQACADFRNVDETSNLRGVWVCTGFGNHGVTLGFGAARLMSQMVHGETPTVHILRAPRLPVFKEDLPKERKKSKKRIADLEASEGLLPGQKKRKTQSGE